MCWKLTTSRLKIFPFLLMPLTLRLEAILKEPVMAITFFIFRSGQHSNGNQNKVKPAIKNHSFGVVFNFLKMF